MIDASKYDRNKHPGKFEGESPATEYFYEQMMNGDGETIYADYETNEYDEKEYNEEDGPHAELFHINAEEHSNNNESTNRTNRRSNVCRVRRKASRQVLSFL
jgi:hypothetical protein